MQHRIVQDEQFTHNYGLDQAAKWQLIYYLWILRQKGIYRRGRLEFIEVNKKLKRTVLYDLKNSDVEMIRHYIKEIEDLVNGDKVPDAVKKRHCIKCAYYEYCFI